MLCRGRDAKKASVYHFKLCRAILVGFRDQLKADGLYKDGFIGILEDSLEQEEIEVYRLSDSSGEVLHVRVEHEPVYRDDLTGQLLPPELVLEMVNSEMW